MNTLAEAEECAICMEEMTVGMCYRSDTNLCTQGFYLNVVLACHASILFVLDVSNDWATVPLCHLTLRQGQSNALIAAKFAHAMSVK